MKDAHSIDLEEPTPCAVDMNIPNVVPVKIRQPVPVYKVPKLFENVDNMKRKMAKRLSTSVSGKMVQRFRE